jgi:prophage regulatory protein|tara:strand:- start:98 stop:313 length:216 start_codon:yes stop_codon:yes gene_type:complete
MQLLRLSDVTKLTGLSRATVYRLVEKDRFPRPRRIGDRAVAWVNSEVEEWADGLPIANQNINWQGVKNDQH